VLGACCTDADGDGVPESCATAEEAECAGEWQGADTTCDPNPCPVPPECELTPASLDFGEVEVGDSLDLTVTIRNVGGGTLSGTLSADCPDFAVAGDSSYALQTDEAAQFTVRFSPSAEDRQDCVLDTGASQCPELPATGVGIPVSVPSCEISPLELAFEQVALGDTKDLSFTITNTGGGTLAGTVTESCPGFSLVGGGEYSLGAGASRTITVRFAPQTEGEQVCALDTGRDECPDVTATGTGMVSSDCQVSPESLDFGDVNVGETAELTFEISNTGTEPIQGTLSFPEPCPGFFIVGAASYTLQAGESQSFRVRFAPEQGEEYSCAIDTGSGGCADVSVSGTGIPQLCRIDPETLEFGSIGLGRSAVLPFTLTNAGGGTLSGAVSVDCPDFTLLDDPSYALGPGQSRSFDVQFSPTAIGNYACDIATGAAACDGVSAHGTGIAPAACVLSADTLEFGEVAVGEFRDLDLTVTNTGAAPLRGEISVACADFLIVGDGGYDLGAGESADLVVRFEPSSRGSRVCPVDLGSAECGEIVARGTGVPVPAPECGLSQQALDFGRVQIGEPAQLQCAVTNLGTGTLSGVASADCPEFEVIGESSYDLGPGQTKILTVEFAPDSPGDFACELDLGASECTPVQLTGTAIPIPEPICEVEPTLLDFGTVVVGESADRELKISNLGEAPLTGRVTVDCPAFFVSGRSDFAVNPGSSATIVIRFLPAVTGEASCDLETGSDLCPAVSLTGTARPEPDPACGVAPLTLDFGFVEVGGSATRTITVENTGGGILSGSLAASGPEYAFLDNDLSFTLPAGESREFALEFTPLSLGEHGCSIQIEPEGCGPVPVTGSGYSGQVSLSTLSNHLQDISLGVAPEDPRVGAVFSDLGGLSSSGWELSRWSPADSAYVSAGRGLDTVDIGEGYWLYTSGSGTIQISGEPESSPQHAVPLASGRDGLPAWNQFGNPYQRAVPIDQVWVAGDGGLHRLADSENVSTERVIWGWDGERYRPADVLEPFRAYWIRKLGGGDADLVLLRDDSGQPGAGPAPADPREAFLNPGPRPTPEPQWFVTLTARQGERISQELSMGAAPGEAGVWNPLDLAHPPSPPGDPLTLFLPHDDWGTMSGRYLREFQPTSDPMIWNARLEGTERLRSVRLELAEEGLPADARLYLTNRSQGAVYQIHPPEELFVTPRGEALELRLVASFAPPDSLPPETIPPVVSLAGFPYATPNPFIDRTELAFDLSRPGNLRVSIFDPSGRQLRELRRRDLPAGETSVVWDGDDDEGDPVPAGVYLVRYASGKQSGGFRLVRLN
jgi:hypothetical protein